MFNDKPYDMERVFEGILNGTFFPKHGTPVREFPNYDKVINRYKNVLFRTEPTLVIREINGQHYARLIEYGDDGFYNVSWNISHAQKIIKRDRLQPQSMHTLCL